MILLGATFCRSLPSRVMEPEEAVRSPERGGLAGAVCADEGHQFPLAHGKGYALEGVDSAVKNIQVFDFQHVFSLLTVQDRRR